VGQPFQLVDNRPCLDFINTEAVSQGEPVDFLRSVQDLVDWLVATGLITEADQREAARSRRWCSMDGCGSRAKAAAYYRRRHAKGKRR
jgi:hypothetical protein